MPPFRVGSIPKGFIPLPYWSIILSVSTICDHKSISYGKCDHTLSNYPNLLYLQYILSDSPGISIGIVYGVTWYDTL